MGCPGGPSPIMCPVLDLCFTVFQPPLWIGAVCLLAVLGTKPRTLAHARPALSQQALAAALPFRARPCPTHCSAQDLVPSLSPVCSFSSLRSQFQTRAVSLLLEVCPEAFAYTLFREPGLGQQDVQAPSLHWLAPSPAQVPPKVAGWSSVHESSGHRHSPLVGGT